MPVDAAQQIESTGFKILSIVIDGAEFRFRIGTGCSGLLEDSAR
jgi:hypothetical protein